MKVHITREAIIRLEALMFTGTYSEQELCTLVMQCVNEVHFSIIRLRLMLALKDIATIKEDPCHPSLNE